MSKFISCNFMGGLGNQMFQAAHAVSQGLRTKRETIFLKNSFTPMQGNQTSNYINNVFRNLNFVEKLPNEYDLVREKSWDYNETVPSQNNCVFDGYFQSSKNFLGFDNQIQKLFAPTENFKEEFLNKYSNLQNENTLSIHIRRGDCFFNLDIHPVANEKYVEKCLEILGDYEHVFVFSDDKKWVKENLKLSNCTFVENLDDYEEMWMMSLCKNNIIVNSTFSWWSSFLNINPNKKIIAPSIWFGPRGPQKYLDIYENYWKVVNVTYKNGFLE